MDPIIALLEALLNAFGSVNPAEFGADESGQAALASARQDAVSPVLATTDIAATLGQMEAAAVSLAESGRTDDETLETLEALALGIELIRGEQARRDGETSARTERAAAALAKIRPDAGPAATASTDTPVEPQPDGDGDQGDGDDGDEPGEPAPTASTEPTAASVMPRVPQPSLAALTAVQPPETKADAAPTGPALPPVRVKAANDVPGFHVGADITTKDQLVAAVMARQEALGGHGGGNIVGDRVAVATFDYTDRLQFLTNDPVTNGLLLQAAGNEDALTASGGFCAPTEIVYDFVKINEPDGLAQDFLPTVGSTRGSVQYPTSPDIRDAFTANPSRAYSNQQDINGTTKTVTTIACPQTHTCTVGSQYVILKFGNFGTRAYPEWVAHWLGLSMDVHAHQVSSKLIGQMITASNTVVAVGPNGGATATLFGNIGMAAADYRSDLRMRVDAPLEVVLPIWTPDLIRSDLARARKGTLETLNVTDAQIASWFAALNVVPRYVTDWQTVSGNAATGTTVWPAGLNFLIYAPGTFVKLDMGTLDLGVVRDSVLNATNDYHIFVETFEVACKVGVESRQYSVSICANGAFSADQNLNCAAIDIPGS